MTDRRGPVAAVQKRASAALGEMRKAVGELAGALNPGRVAEDELLVPVRRLVRGVAGVAELAVDPLVQLIDLQRKFVEGQRNLADQMTAWAELQRQLADRIADWADVQRQIANAMDKSLAPVSGAAHMTTRLLDEVAGKPAKAPARGRGRGPAKAAGARATPARRASATARTRGSASRTTSSQSAGASSSRSSVASSSPRAGASRRGSTKLGGSPTKSSTRSAG